jgi:nicotinamide-nucleotide amidase
MIGEIIAIGDELTSGRITNTTSAFAAHKLFLAGHEITAMHTVGDVPKLIGDVLRRSIRRSDFVIVTGGLGPTTDDLTNEAVAQALDRPAAVNAVILEKIQQLPNRQALEKLAWLPEGAEILDPDEWMAGHVLIHEATPVFFLPGIPGQAVKLLIENVLPRLARWSQTPQEQVQTRLYKTCGLSEAEINRRLASLEAEKQMHLGYYPVAGEVHVSLYVPGRGNEALFVQADQFIHQSLGPHVYGIEQENLVEVLGELVQRQRLRLAVAESCTGGLIGAKITAQAGSSAWFMGGIIAYSNHLKEELLAVDRQLLQEHGAVSGPVVEAMVVGLAARTGTALAVAVSGLAGPTGGSKEKPVGTVYIGLLHQQQVSSRCYHFCGTRQEIQEITASTALDTVRLALLADTRKIVPPAPADALRRQYG